MMMNKELNHMYKVAAYERLSREDDRKEESSSIESQRMIIESFAKFNNFIIIKHYSDDGFTGSNFDRPGFERLKKDIEAKKIDCVIVKDLSRLGREMYLTGSYIEQYFLSRNVRFIAINDGYDSLIGDSMLGIRLSVNDMYLRDTSKKIRSSLDAKRKNGDYIATYAKYGYMKDPQNTKHLIIDPNTAPIVKDMFKWASEGLGVNKIATKLTEMQIPVPHIYKKEFRSTANSDLNQGNGVWRPQTVKDILIDEMYLGHMIQGKWKRLSYNSKKLVTLPRSQWIIVKNTHEPIIDQETFDTVQLKLKKNKKHKPSNVENHLLQGLLVCKECGHGLTITKKSNSERVYNAQCTHYAKYGKLGKCTSHYLRYDSLEEDILMFLQEVGKNILYNKNIDEIIKAAELDKGNELSKHYKRLKEIDLLIKKHKATILHMYQDYMNDLIQRDEYAELAKIEREKTTKLEEEKIEINQKITSSTNSKSMEERYEECKKIVEDSFNFKNISSEAIRKIIDKIVVDKDKNIEIHFKADFEKFCSLNKKKGDN